LRPDFYAAAHPRPQDVLLVVEVADTSVGYDQEAKLPRYAQTSIAEAWVVNVPEDRLEVYRQPTSQGYQEARYLRRGEQLIPVAFPDLSLTADAILGTNPA
jgi:Uma2 family endonuclease